MILLILRKGCYMPHYNIEGIVVPKLTADELSGLLGRAVATSRFKVIETGSDPEQSPEGKLENIGAQITGFVTDDCGRDQAVVTHADGYTSTIDPRHLTPVAEEFYGLGTLEEFYELPREQQ